MTPSDLKYHFEIAHPDSSFFSRESMKFAGDTMKNYGVRSTTIISHYNVAGDYVAEGVELECWELYRKRPVAYGLQKSVYFEKSTLKVMHSKD